MPKKNDTSDLKMQEAIYDYDYLIGPDLYELLTPMLSDLQTGSTVVFISTPSSKGSDWIKERFLKGGDSKSRDSKTNMARKMQRDK